jgi:hypothetical protein
VVGAGPAIQRRSVISRRRLDVNDVPTVDYATPTRGRRFDWRAAARITVIVVASLAFAWSLLMRSQLVLSNRGLPVPNEHFAVRVLVNDPSSRGEFRFYSISSFAGFHFVDWREWHRDGRYLLIPKWANRFTHGRRTGFCSCVLHAARPRDNQALERTGRAERFL